MILLARLDRGRTTDGAAHKLFGSLLVFGYHCFDRIVINGYLEHLARRELVVHFCREVFGIRAITKEALERGRRNTSSRWERTPGLRRFREVTHLCLPELTQTI